MQSPCPAGQERRRDGSYYNWASLQCQALFTVGVVLLLLGFSPRRKYPKFWRIWRKGLAFLLWEVFPNVYPALFPVPTDFLTSHFIPLFQGQNLTAVTGQLESGWPFKATFFPPRAVWLGWRR